MLKDNRMEKECFIFLSDENKYGSMYPILLHDVLEKDNVYFVDRTFKYKGKIFEMFKKVMFSTMLNLKLKEKPCRWARKFLKEKYLLKDMVKEKIEKYEKVNIVVFNASVKRYYSAKILKEIKNLSDKISMHIFFMDPSTIFASEKAIQLIDESPELFDKVFTVDKTDSKMRNWKFWPTPYCKIMECDTETNDIYFCGATKKRNKLLVEIYKYFERYNIKCKWDVFYIKKNEDYLNELQQVIDVKSIKHMKAYEDTISEMTKASCILELITEGQSATYTLRAYEAVLYNKKLLTNNKNIFEFPYYDSRYMKYFEKKEDIDMEWLKNKEPVEYNYKGEYSPERLLKEISNE